MSVGSCLPGEEAAANAFSEKHRDLFSQGEKLLQLSFSFKPLITMRRDEAQFFQAVIGLCSKSIKTFRGIHLLCSRGLCDDALALSRTLLEILTSITHLNSGDRASNAKQFWEFAILKTDELNSLFDKAPNEKKEPPEAEDEVQRFIRSVKSRMNEKKLKDWLRGSWHKKHVVPLAKA